MTLKPCPFCGNELIYGDVHRFGMPNITCSGCSLIITPDDAARRTPPPATKAMKEWAEFQLRMQCGEYRDFRVWRPFIAEWPGPAKEADGPQAGTIRRSALAIQRTTPDELRETLERSERTKEES